VKGYVGESMSTRAIIDLGLAPEIEAIVGPLRIEKLRLARNPDTRRLDEILPPVRCALSPKPYRPTARQQRILDLLHGEQRSFTRAELQTYIGGRRCSVGEIQADLDQLASVGLVGQSTLPRPMRGPKPGPGWELI